MNSDGSNNAISIVKGVHARPITQVRVIMKELHGMSLSPSVTQWDIREFLKKEFGDSIIDLNVETKWKTVGNLML
jgi:hypothetical protein